MVIVDRLRVGHDELDYAAREVTEAAQRVPYRFIDCWREF
ncbi:hypothetical protein Cflav_PD2899 [Pedosphaera parvula Ellin514]|uniref:Uncharacterized protein n=2 Tax=Pedosphaera TaxID=1032526 RepID=B9XMJ8_PEDPL|nr:hypothetical protein Cflav_PD2899 [Pedosphaera parvula Ellin514]